VVGTGDDPLRGKARWRIIIAPALGGHLGTRDHMTYRRALLATTLALTFGVLAAPRAAASYPADSTPCAARLISAHEGYTAEHDGDTVESQVAAFDIGSNIADSDLWLTKDGYIVQIHDNDVSHTTDGTGLVTEMTLEQVLALRTKRHHEKVPQLKDSLELPIAHEPGRYLMFEAKYSFAGKAKLRQLAREIAAAGMTDHVIIYAAYLRHAQALKKIDPGLTVWYKSQEGVPSVRQVACLDGVMIPAGSLKREVTDQFHAVGMSVIRERVSVEDDQAWQRFVHTRADGLMTSHPKVAIEECRNLA
jgi:glycerophosphoryl diester phosphodiesterase